MFFSNKTSQCLRFASFIFIFTTLFSCSNLEQSAIQPQNQAEKAAQDKINALKSKGISLKNGRINFANDALFIETVSTLAEHPSLLTTWENTFPSFESWSAYNQKAAKNDLPALTLCEDCLELPNFYTVVINTNKEYQVGNTVVFVDNGKMYEVPAALEASLKENGKFVTSKLSTIPQKAIEQKVLQNKASANYNKSEAKQKDYIDAPYQYQYSRNGHTFKQVIEMAGLQLSSGADSKTVLYLRVKLEYLRRNQWLPAGESRVIEINNFTGFSQYPPFQQQPVFKNINVTPMATNKDYVVALNSIEGGGLSADKWQYNMQGFISIHVPSHGQCLPMVCTDRGLLGNMVFQR